MSKTVLITGANRGIGLATAQVLAQHGYEVILTARDLKSLKKAASAVPSAAGLMALNVSDEASCRALAKELSSKKVKLHALVNNAGKGGPSPISSKKTAAWQDIIQVNLVGTYLVTQALLPLIVEGGAVLNFSSVLGRFGVPGYTAYCAAKHGVIGFTRALALELAPRGIRVNAVCPGWVDTRMATEGLQDMATGMKTSLEDARKMAESGVPLGKFLEPQEVGELVAWMIGPHSRNMTGQAITLDGGQVMQ